MRRVNELSAPAVKEQLGEAGGLIWYQQYSGDATRNQSW
jgi:hypothetical protein